MNIYRAKCEGKAVSIDQGDGVFTVVPDAFILGDGTAASEGFCLVGANACLYITETQSDTQAVISAISNAIDSAVISPAATADTGGGAPTVNVIVSESWASLSESLKGMTLK